MLILVGLGMAGGNLVPHYPAAGIGLWMVALGVVLGRARPVLSEGEQP